MDSGKVKKGLGRGLSSLIGETEVETKKNQLITADLIPNKYQPRKNFDETSLFFIKEINEIFNFIYSSSKILF